MNHEINQRSLLQCLYSVRIKIHVEIRRHKPAFSFYTLEKDRSRPPTQKNSNFCSARSTCFAPLDLHLFPFAGRASPYLYAYVLKVFHETVLPVESHAFPQLVLACFHDVINVYCAAFSSRKNPFKLDYCFVSVVAFLFS